MLGQFTTLRMMIEGVSCRGPSVLHNLRGSNKVLFCRQLQEAEALGALEEDMGTNPGRFIVYFVVKTRAIPQECAKFTIQKQKEITEAEARQNQPKQVLHTASCHSPYIPEYVGNHPVASVASASQSQASWPQLPPPPPLQPAYLQGQQPEGSHQTHQQRELREESEARTVNSTVPESKHIY
jgi:hypothetical protein